MIRRPAGRAGRLWLRHRLAVAQRAGEVLEQKTRSLIDEERRLAYLVERTGEGWKRACQDAETWHLRAMLLGGERQISLVQSVAGDYATVDIRYRTTMGATYPYEVNCRLPELVATAELGRSSALPFAAAAYREALEAAVQHAAASRALDVVRSELDVTRRRLRGIQHGWTPRLVEQLRRVELALAEKEREDMVAARWSLNRSDDE